MDQLEYALETGKYGKRQRKDWLEALNDPNELRETHEDKLVDEQGYALYQKLKTMGGADGINWNAPPSEDKPAKEDSGEGDELQDAKFEPYFRRFSSSNDDGEGVRKKRERRRGTDRG